MLTPVGFKELKQNDQPQLLPHNTDAEGALLGALLIDPDQMIECNYLKPADFFLVRNGRLYAALLALFEKEQTYDYVMVCAEIEVRGWMSDVGGPAGITDLIEMSYLSYNAPALADIVFQHSMRRQIINAATKTVQAAHAPGADQRAEDLSNAAIQALADIDTTRKSSSGPKTLKGGVSGLFDLVERVQAGQSMSILTGLKDLDRTLNGLDQDKFYILAGRPGMGKSSLAIQIAYNAAKRGKRVLIFALEMGAVDVTARLVSIDSRIPYEQFRNQTADFDMSRFIQSGDSVSSLPIVIDDTPALSVPQIRTISQKEMVKNGLDLIIVDHLGIVESGIKGKAYERVSYVADQLMALPKQLGVPVLANCQIGRAVETRGDKRPTMADLRDTGKLEENADGIIFLYRDEVYNANTEFPNLAEVIIAKNRGGKTGSLSVFSLIETSRFVDLEVNRVAL